MIQKKQNIIRKGFRKIEWKVDFLLIKIWRLILFRIYRRNLSNIIIFGSGRSGTSWLGDILSQIDRTILVDEPLKNTNSYKIDKIGLTGWGQFIPEDETNWSEAYYFFERLLKGLEFNPNHVRDNSKLFTADILIFKFIRASLLMPWLINNFHLRKPIYIIRNPYAVVASRLKHSGWGLDKPLDTRGNLEMPRFKYYNEFYTNYSTLYNKINRLEELLTFQWIMENEYVINHSMNNKKWLTISYEELIVNPGKTILRIEEALKLKLNIEDTGVFEKPSYSSIETVIDVSSQLNKWKSVLNDSQIALISGMLNQSSLSDIYKLDSYLPSHRIYE